MHFPGVIAVGFVRIQPSRRPENHSEDKNSDVAPAVHAYIEYEPSFKQHIVKRVDGEI
ncbi:MAG: hypothetical protein P8Q15_02035 [Methylophilaceae bacterium]|nr:hypothetical protein [Methylophilaceae bacterium]